MPRTEDQLESAGPADGSFGPPAGKTATTPEMRDVVARMAEFTQLPVTAPGGGNGTLDLFSDITITLSAQLGQTVLSIGDMLKLGPGATVGLDREVHQPVDLVVGGKVFARGEVVVVNDRFAIRIKELAVNRPGSTGAP